jgi:methylisocitrate lyase
MAARIAAAVKARRRLYIVARTDAVANEGLESAIARAKTYVDAGADAIFPEALTSPDMLKAFAEHIKVPLLANMTEFGRTPPLSAKQLQSLGYKMVIWPVSALRVAAKAQGSLFETLRRDGHVQSMLGSMQTRAELYDTIRYFDYEALDASIVKTVMP